MATIFSYEVANPVAEIIWEDIGAPAVQTGFWSMAVPPEVPFLVPTPSGSFSF